MSLTVNSATAANATTSTAATANHVDNTDKMLQEKLNGNKQKVGNNKSDRSKQIADLKAQAHAAGIPEKYLMNIIKSEKSLDNIKIDVKNHSLKTTSTYSNDTVVFKNGKIHQTIIENKEKGKIVSKQVSTVINAKGDMKIEYFKMKNGKYVPDGKPVIWTKEEQDMGV